MGQDTSVTSGLRPRDDFYAIGMAGAADVFLVIEVADSLVRYDETVNRLSGG